MPPKMSITQARQSALWDIGFIVACSALGVLVPYINGAVHDVLTHYGLLHGSFDDNVFIAALTEPWTSKLFGVALFLFAGLGVAVGLTIGTLLTISGSPYLGLAVAVGTAVVLQYEIPSVNLLQKRWTAAPMAGFIFGVEELYYRMLPEFTWFFWENPAFHPNILAPVVLHVITGSLVVFALLSAVSPRSRHGGLLVLGAIIVATGLHFVFNTFLQAVGKMPLARAFWLDFHLVWSDLVFGAVVIGLGLIAISLLRDLVTLISP